jgi:DnaJ-class molecular chaperone
MTTFGCDSCDGMGIKIVRIRERRTMLQHGDGEQTVEVVKDCKTCGGLGMSRKKIAAYVRAQRKLNEPERIARFAKHETTKKALEDLSMKPHEGFGNAP